MSRFFNTSSQLFDSLGHGDSSSRNLPTLVKDISNVGQVVCGSSHTIAISQDGRIVWSFGSGDNGILLIKYDLVVHVWLLLQTWLQLLVLFSPHIKMCFNVRRQARTW